MLAFMRIGNQDDANREKDIAKRSTRRAQPQKIVRNQVTDLSEQTDIARVERLVDQTIGGRVMWEAVSYPAYCTSDQAFQAGTFVKVLGRQNNVLIVGALSTTASCPRASSNQT